MSWFEVVLEVKKERFMCTMEIRMQEHNFDIGNVLGVFEDRDRVVKMWRDLGITCFQVAEGDF